MHTEWAKMIEDQFQAYHTYGELINALKSLCRERATGTMFIATPDNHFVRIVLTNGEISAASFRTKHGVEALPLIRRINAGRFKFSEGQITADAAASLPPGNDALRVLADDGMSLNAVDAAQRSLTADKIVLAPKIIERELAEYLGPIAGIVCSEHVGRIGAPRQVGDVASLLEAVAREIRDPRKVRAFKEQVWLKLTSD